MDTEAKQKLPLNNYGCCLRCTCNVAEQIGYTAQLRVKTSSKHVERASFVVLRPFHRINSVNYNDISQYLFKDPVINGVIVRR